MIPQAETEIKYKTVKSNIRESLRTYINFLDSKYYKHKLRRTFFNSAYVATMLFTFPINFNDK